MNFVISKYFNLISFTTFSFYSIQQKVQIGKNESEKYQTHLSYYRALSPLYL